MLEPVSASFIQLDPFNVAYLFVVGFIGGLVSGFIGSGGAFVLTPAMMGLGAPGIVAVASNICHKFPKALVGSIKRAKYGQVDVKLGIVLGVSAEAGMLYGAHIQESIRRAFGNDGSNLYVSVVFVVVLALVGGYVLRDAWRIYRSGDRSESETLTKLARAVQALNVPGTMVYFPSIKTKISVLVTVPIGFAAGILAATIAVGGFIGVPAMIYVLGVPSLMASATELVIAFIMGVGGTIKYGWGGYVDIRLAMIILAGSLFGIQLGAIGTTYVKPYMVKVVMGTIMIVVLISRAIAIPVYLSDLDVISRLSADTARLLEDASFAVMVVALLLGAFIILRALASGVRASRAELAAAAATAIPRVPARAPSQLSPLARFDRILVATDGSEFSAGALEVATGLAKRSGGELTTVTVALIDLETEGIATAAFAHSEAQARKALEDARSQAHRSGVETTTELRSGTNPYREIVRCADDLRSDVIVMGRRGRRGLARMMVGDATRQVIGTADSNVLVVPRLAAIWRSRILLATDGSRHSESAAVVAARLAKMFAVPVSVVTVFGPKHDEARRADGRAAAQRLTDALVRDGIDADCTVVEGEPATEIVAFATGRGADLIVAGSHGRTGVGRLIVGSVCEKIIGQAVCPVLVVKL